MSEDRINLREEFKKLKKLEGKKVEKIIVHPEWISIVKMIFEDGTEVRIVFAITDGYIKVVNGDKSWLNQ